MPASRDLLSATPIGQQLIRATGAASARIAIERLAQQALNDAGITRCPIDVRRVASFRGVRRVVAVDMEQAGRLIPVSGGALEIHIRSGDPIERQNFTIAHEIGHTLVPGYRENPHPFDEDMVDSWSSGQRDPLEELCDIAAAELLMPMALFGPEAAQFGCYLTTARHLRRCFGSSWPATLRRMVETNLWCCAMTVWTNGLDQPRLLYSVASDRFPYALLRGFPASPDGCIGQMLSTGKTNTNVEIFRIDDHTLPFAVFARRSRSDWTTTPRTTVTALILPCPEGEKWPAAATTWPPL